MVHRQPVFRGRVVSEGRPVKHFRVDDHEVDSADGRFELALPATEERDHHGDVVVDGLEHLLLALAADEPLRLLLGLLVAVPEALSEIKLALLNQLGTRSGGS